MQVVGEDDGLGPCRLIRVGAEIQSGKIRYCEVVIFASTIAQVGCMRDEAFKAAPRRLERVRATEVGIFAHLDEIAEVQSETCQST